MAEKSNNSMQFYLVTFGMRSVKMYNFTLAIRRSLLERGIHDGRTFPQLYMMDDFWHVSYINVNLCFRTYWEGAETIINYEKSCKCACECHKHKYREQCSSYHEWEQTTGSIVYRNTKKYFYSPINYSSWKAHSLTCCMMNTGTAIRKTRLNLAGYWTRTNCWDCHVWG